MSEIQCSYEIYRKLIHISSIIFSIAYIFTNKTTMILVVLISSLVFISSDYLRNYNQNIKICFDFFFFRSLRPDEAIGRRFTSATYMFAAFIITLICFDKYLVINSWLILSIADTLASIIGRKFGTQTIYGKSILGSGVFYLTSIFISYGMHSYFAGVLKLPIIIFACLITSIAEFFSNNLKLDDNLLIPVVFCSTYYTISYLNVIIKFF